MPDIRSWRDIPGFFDFQDVYDQAVAEASDGDVLVEVGSFLGKSVSYLADRAISSGKKIRVVAIDPWDEQDNMEWWIHCDHPYPDPPAGLNLIGKTIWAGFNYCIREAGVDEHIETLRMKSEDAAFRFSDASLSFVFIDADHRYHPVANDISLWRAKVKPGGILGGHDYTAEWPGVVQAVDEAFPGRVERHGCSWLVRL